MTVFFYNIFLLLYKLGIRISSLFNPKAKKWQEGRKNIFTKLEAAISKNVRLNDSFGQEKIVWVHCSSLGEFEQGKPLIEKLKSQYPNSKFLLTFFSPSGYEVQENYKGADWVFYLPMDGAINSRRFLEIVNPSLVIFIKYDYWYYYLKKIKYRNIPLILVSALFQKDSIFFKWYGSFQRKMLTKFDHLFVQNEESKQLLEKVGIKHCSVSGDTRFDRVIEIAERFEPIPLIEEFIGNNKCVVAGSTWKEDEEIISRYIKEYDHPHNKNDKRWIIAPHEIAVKHLEDLKALFPKSLFYSELKSGALVENKNVLIIDNVGMLSRLYKYATVVLIGGGFSKTGVHNVLEAAVYGKPIMFGPNYSKYYEVVQLINKGGAICINDHKEFDVNIDIIAYSKEEISDFSRKSKGYVYSNKGATEKIINYIQEKRLLTS